MDSIRFRSKRVIAAMLAMIVLSHVVVWGHSHASLSGRVLAKHLARFHEGGAPPVPRDVWHTHDQWRAPATLGDCDRDLEPDRNGLIAVDTLCERRTPCSRDLARARSQISSGPWGPPRHRRALHLQLSIFVI